MKFSIDRIDNKNYYVVKLPILQFIFCSRLSSLCDSSFFVLRSEPILEYYSCTSLSWDEISGQLSKKILFLRWEDRCGGISKIQEMRISKMRLEVILNKDKDKVEAELSNDRFRMGAKRKNWKS